MDINHIQSDIAALLNEVHELHVNSADSDKAETDAPRDRGKIIAHQGALLEQAHQILVETLKTVDEV